jgi:hypothetical protein
VGIVIALPAATMVGLEEGVPSRSTAGADSPSCAPRFSSDSATSQSDGTSAMTSGEGGGSGGGFGRSSLGELSIRRGGGLGALGRAEGEEPPLNGVARGRGAEGLNIDRGGGGRSLDFVGGAPLMGLAIELPALELAVTRFGAVSGFDAGESSEPSIEIDALHLRQGRLPCLARRTRTTSSPTPNSVEHTLHLICMSPTRQPQALRPGGAFFHVQLIAFRTRATSNERPTSGGMRFYFPWFNR